MDCNGVRTSRHAMERMFQRQISPTALAIALRTGEVIADYPDDTPYASVLLLAIIEGEPLHAVVARDPESGLRIVVAVYRPDPLRLGKRRQKQERTVKCVLCKTGITHPGHVTVTLERGQTVVVIKGVSAEVCANCGEYYLDEQVSQRVYPQADDAARRNAEVEILRYAA